MSSTRSRRGRPVGRRIREPATVRPRERHEPGQRHSPDTGQDVQPGRRARRPPAGPGRPPSGRHRRPGPCQAPSAPAAESIRPYDQQAAQPGLPRAYVGDAIRVADVGVLALLLRDHDLRCRDRPPQRPRHAPPAASRAASAGSARRRRPPTGNGRVRETPRPARRCEDTRRKSSLSYRDIPERRKGGAKVTRSSLLSVTSRYETRSALPAPAAGTRDPACGPAAGHTLGSDPGSTRSRDR